MIKQFISYSLFSLNLTDILQLFDIEYYQYRTLSWDEA